MVVVLEKGFHTGFLSDFTQIRKWGHHALNQRAESVNQEIDSYHDYFGRLIVFQKLSREISRKLEESSSRTFSGIADFGQIGQSV